MKNWKLEGKIVLLRVDFNVPIDKGIITDDTRIVKSLVTIKRLLEDNAKLVIMSHLGRPLKSLLPDGQLDKIKFSLAPVAKRLSELLGRDVLFSSDCGGADTKEKLTLLQSGRILLLENTRFYKQEEKGDPAWAEELAHMGDYYINDAFGAAHREHATTATIARFFDKNHKGFGLLMDAELQNAAKVIQHPEKPLTAIVGGAKVSDKIELISNLIDKCDNILIGGGMAYTFFAAQGHFVGNSICETDKLELAKELLEKARTKGVKLLLPLDSIAADSFSNEAKTITTTDANVPEGYMGLDIGPETIKLFNKTILESKTIVWNGPMGVFEMSSFENGTKNIAMTVAEATRKGAFSLIGGGDSVAAINKYGLDDEVSFVSTGGGAMLELLEGKVLPGVAAILHE
jgi:phosphoglycerate kinase